MLKVINTGNLNNGFQNSDENTSIGLENLKKRLKINFGEKAKFDIEEQNGFVIATIILPLEVGQIISYWSFVTGKQEVGIMLQINTYRRLILCLR